ncbi:MAG: cyclodeaminase/cyclohydrolase family protein [Candidatus Zapsychrus exili]|nr:cyclodeaminase/cyclohydrolase family protein [Candidatus Zapsychrus exili]
MKKYKNYLISDYLKVLSEKKPTPGGGSVAALVGATASSLVLMVANYSKGKTGKKAKESKIKKIILDSEKIRKRLIELIDLDADAYKGVVAARDKSVSEQKKAAKKARGIPLEVCKLCYKELGLVSFLVEEGNKNLMGDIEIAIEMIFASYNSAIVLTKQ